MAYNYGLLWLVYGLLYGIVACYFGLLGVPGKDFWKLRVPLILTASPALAEASGGLSLQARVQGLFSTAGTGISKREGSKPRP